MARKFSNGDVVEFQPKTPEAILQWRLRTPGVMMVKDYHDGWSSGRKWNTPGYLVEVIGAEGVPYDEMGGIDARHLTISADASIVDHLVSRVDNEIERLQKQIALLEVKKIVIANHPDIASSVKRLEAISLLIKAQPDVSVDAHANTVRLLFP